MKRRPSKRRQKKRPISTSGTNYCTSKCPSSPQFRKQSLHTLFFIFDKIQLVAIEIVKKEYTYYEHKKLSRAL